MSQIDEIARMLEESGQSAAEKRASAARGPLVSRRTVLIALGGAAGMGVLGAAGVGVAKLVGGEDEGMAGVPANGAPVAPTASASAAPAGVDGVVVWSGAVGATEPVLAPGGTGAVIDSEGHVQILGSGKVLARSTDVTPSAVLVAGQDAGADVIAWTTGKNLSWWTAAGGMQRAKHPRPVGLSAVGGGILAFDDEQWSGRVTGGEVLGVPTASDAITIGVRPDGETIAATSDGIITLTPASGQAQIVQPSPPSTDAQVWRVAGLVGECAVLVWAVPGRADLACPVTTLSLDSGQTVGSGSADRAAVQSGQLMRCARGAGFAGLLFGLDGEVRPVPGGDTVTGSEGDLLAGADAAGPVSIDPGAGTAGPSGMWRLSGQKVAWIKDETTVWFMDVQSKEGS